MHARLQRINKEASVGSVEDIIEKSAELLCSGDMEKQATRRYKELWNSLSDNSREMLLKPQPTRVKQIPSEVAARMEKDAPFLSPNYKVHDYDRELRGSDKGRNVVAKKQGFAFVLDEEGIPVLRQQKPMK